MDALTPKGGEGDPRDRDPVGRLAEQVRSAPVDIAPLPRGAQQATLALTSPELAARQAAIVEAAREEAAVVIAAAQADAARILARAVASGCAADGSRNAPMPDHPHEIDLRGSTPRPDVAAQDPRPLAYQSSASVDVARTLQSAPEVASSTRERLAAVDAELRAAISEASHMANQVEAEIARLSRERPTQPE